MKLDVNQMLLLFSFMLGFVERDLLKDVTNHTRHIAYICARPTELMNLPERELFDLISYASSRGNGIARSLPDGNPAGMVGLGKNIRRCEAGEEDVSYFLFNHPILGVILYHHECQNGSDFLGKRGEEIPFFFRSIALSNRAAVECAQRNTLRDILGMLKKDARLFNPELLRLFLHTLRHGELWLNMQPMFTESELERLFPQETWELGYQNICRISRPYSNIIDAKSPLTGGHSRGTSKKVGVLRRHYGCGEEEYWKMRIAADLYGLGKIMVPNEVLDKPGSLTREKIDVVQSHTYYTHKALEMVQGFEDITEWAINHHEKLNGREYPYGLTANQLDFNPRVLACVDIYQALTEDRPHRTTPSHEESVGIFDTVAKQNLTDGSVVRDIDTTLGTVSRGEDLKMKKSR